MDADSWKAYVHILERCDKLRLEDGNGWSVFGETCCYVHTIEEVKRIAHRSSWVGLTDEERTMELMAHGAFWEDWLQQGW